MKQFFCLMCDYVWHGVYIYIYCPECGSPDIERDVTSPDMDGFFEGDMGCLGSHDSSEVE